MVLWMRKLFQSLLCSPVLDSVFEVLPSRVAQAFLCQCCGASTSLAGLQCLWSAAADWIRSVSVLFALLYLHLTHLHSCSRALCLDRHSSLVILTSEPSSALQTKATIQAKLCEEELQVLGHGIIRPFMPQS